MRVHVDEDRCEGHGVCASLVPLVFRLDDELMSRVIDDTPPPSLEPALRQAVRRCPRAAVIVDEG